MVNLHDRNPLIGIVACNLPISGKTTNVFGGPMTAGTFDADGSGSITYPAFKITPVVIGQVVRNTAGASTAVGGYLTFTGVGTSTAYVRMGNTIQSGCTVSIQITGIQQI